jgi:aldehyde dehydrogenase (NAD+)
MAAARNKDWHTDPKVIAPMKSGLLPPPNPEGTTGNRRPPMYLPPRDLCMDYVARFFDQIHCIYWFYSSEQFYSRLDETYEMHGTTSSSSWLCALYSIFAMGSMRPRDSGALREGLVESKSPLEYCSMARQLLATAADEAGVDSIKAFALLVRLEI